MAETSTESSVAELLAGKVGDDLEEELRRLDVPEAEIVAYRRGVESAMLRIIATVATREDLQSGLNGLEGRFQPQFDAIWREFESVRREFESVRREFESVRREIDQLRTDLNARMDRMERRFMLAMTGVGGGILAVFGVSLAQLFGA